MLPIGAQQPQQGGTDFISDIKQWWENLALFTKIIAIGTVIVYLLSFVISKIALKFGSIPLFTVYEYEVYRLLTCPLVNISILQILFGFLAFLPLSGRLEKELGTLNISTDFLVKNLEIQICFTVFCFIIGQVIPLALLLQSSGLWPVFMLYLSQACFKNPDQNYGFWCLPINIPGKFYPIFLILMFSLFGGQIQFDLLIAVLLAYLHILKNKEYVKPSDNFIKKIEEMQCLSCVTQHKSKTYFVSLGQRGQMNPPSVTPSRSVQNVNQPPPAPPLRSFGGKGVQIGGSSPGTVYNNNTNNSNTRNPDRYRQLDEEEDEEL